MTDVDHAIVIEPGNPHDFDATELAELAAQVSAAAGARPVRVSQRPEHGYGVTLQEVLYVWDLMTNTAGELALDLAPFVAVVAWAKKRWNRDRDEHDQPRPRSVTLFGPDGRPIKQIKIDLPDGEPVDEDPRDEERPVPP